MKTKIKIIGGIGIDQIKEDYEYWLKEGHTVICTSTLNFKENRVTYLLITYQENEKTMDSN